MAVLILFTASFISYLPQLFLFYYQKVIKNNVHFVKNTLILDKILLVFIFLFLVFFINCNESRVEKNRL